MGFKSKVGEIQAVYKTADIQKAKIKGSDDSAYQARKIFNRDTLELQEEMKVIFLNRANNTLGWAQISQGGVSATTCDPKSVFSKALIANSSAIIMVHNHPSGNTKPSTQDIQLTKRLQDGAKLLDIALLDHIILTVDGHFSFADEGML